MKRWLWLLIGLSVLGLIVACAGGAETPSKKMASPTPAPTEQPPVSFDETPQGTLEVMESLLQPFSVSGGLSPLGGLTAGSGGAFPGSLVQGGPLEQMLLSADDVPAEYQQLFAGSFNLDAGLVDPSLGQMTMAMAMFADEAQQQGIMSIVVQAENADVLQQSLAEANEFDFAQIQEAFDAFSTFGIQVTNVRQVDASGLGDGGFGFGFTMDFSQLSAELGEAYGSSEFTNLDMEMVMFVDGSLMGMVATFAMDDAALPARQWAEIMAAKMASATV